MHSFKIALQLLLQVILSLLPNRYILQESVHFLWFGLHWKGFQQFKHAVCALAASGIPSSNPQNNTIRNGPMAGRPRRKSMRLPGFS